MSEIDSPKIIIKSKDKKKKVFAVQKVYFAKGFFFHRGSPCCPDSSFKITMKQICIGNHIQ